MSDNHRVEVWAESREDFTRAMQIALSKHRPTHWSEHHDLKTQQQILVLYWGDPGERSGTIISRFLKQRVDRVIDQVWDWLQEAKIGKEPDHDGDNHRGFRIWNGPWSHVSEFGHYSIIAVTPEWQMYGK